MPCYVGSAELYEGYMRRLRLFFNQILMFLGLRRPLRPEDIPHVLNQETLSKVMEEARFLRSQHQVDVQNLAPGEEPGPPKPVGESPPAAS
jgi:hypothetical protein